MACKTIGRFTYDSATVQAVASSANISFATSTVSTKCIACDGQVITINTPGVYSIDANFTFQATGAGSVETQLVRNGNGIPGAHAIDTAAAADDYVSQEINSIITVPTSAPYVTLVFQAEDATSVRVANVIVTKVA